ncbi:hypothetical protein SAMN05216274_10531 [Cryobacterium levicorallinum]|uniref:Uncharacterized protein n=1 Tax=Cryobacterium levicorallinum TaxID=995038 RepID=A0ABY1ECA8_9MICO|nr:hypothetical protein SAMN05216274_10531 [Cryobacterium levicorallinum]
MNKKRKYSLLALAGGLLLAMSTSTAAQAATIQLGSINCGQAYAPYAHILSDTSGSTIQHVHRRSATQTTTFTYSNSLRTVRTSSSNFTTENSSYIYFSSNAIIHGYSTFCDT